MVIDDKNFLLVAMHYYQNPACITIDEFEDDLKRITYIKKQIKKPEKNTRLLLNHLVIFFNVFGDAALYLLFHKVDKEDWATLATFLIFLNQMPNEIPEIGVQLCYLTLNTAVIDELRKL